MIFEWSEAKNQKNNENMVLRLMKLKLRVSMSLVA
jgi:hypothetical protein